MNGQLTIDGIKNLDNYHISFSTLTSLKVLIIRKCGFSSLPDEFGSLSCLEDLALDGNEHLDNLGSSFSKLASLKVLSITSCGLRILPDDFGNLHKLSKLTLCNMERLRNLPSSFKDLTSLGELKILKSALNTLPDDFGTLKSLERLTLGGNEHLDNLSISFSRLTSLKWLSITNCGLKSLPSDFGELSSLEELVLDGNKMLIDLSLSFGDLPLLKVLRITDCELLEIPENFVNLKLERLVLSTMEQLQKLPSSFRKLKALKVLNIINVGLSDLACCFNGMGTVDRRSIFQLENLSLYKMTNMKELCQSIEKDEKTALKELHITGCSLTSLPNDFWRLYKLEKLTMSSMQQLVELCPLFGKLNALKELYIMECGLSSLPDGFEKLCHLEHLNLRDLSDLTELCSSFGSLPALKILTLVKCGLTKLPDSFGSLKRLENLSLKKMVKLCELCPSFGNLKALKFLDVSECGLSILPNGFEKLDTLQHLTLCGNRIVDYPVSSTRLKNLQKLDLSNPPNLLAGNCIEELPEDLAEASISDLHLEGNPISVPPKTIWKQGLCAIKSYLKEKRDSGEKKFCAETINIFGDFEAGKISSVSAEIIKTEVIPQLLGHATLFNASDNSGHDASRNVFHIYRYSNPLLLCSGLYVIFIDLNEAKTDENMCIEKLIRIAVATSKSSKMRIVLVGKLSDIPSAESRALVKDAANISKKLLTALGETLSDANKERTPCNDEVNKLTCLRSRLENTEIAVATFCSTSSAGNNAEFQKVVREHLLPFERIPYRWYLVMDDILQYRNAEFPCLSKKQVREIYHKHIAEDLKFEMLPIILKYLSDNSLIIWLEERCRYNDTICCSPQFLTDTCAKLLNYDKVMQFVPSAARDLVEDKKLYEQGILTEGLLCELLELHEPQNNTIIDFLQHLYFLTKYESYQTENGTTKRTFLMTSNLPKKAPSSFQLLEKELNESFTRICVNLSFFGSEIPRSFFERSLSIVLKDTKAHSSEKFFTAQWHDGLCVSTEQVYMAMTWLGPEKITLSAGSSSLEWCSWPHLLHVVELLNNDISTSWPGLIPKWEIICPACKWLEECNHERPIIGTAKLIFSQKHTSMTDDNFLFKECAHTVPGILYGSKNFHTSGQQQQITDFYRKLGRQRSEDSQGTEPMKNSEEKKRTDFSEYDSSKEKDLFERLGTIRNDSTRVLISETKNLRKLTPLVRNNLVDDALRELSKESLIDDWINETCEFLKNWNRKVSPPATWNSIEKPGDTNKYGAILKVVTMLSAMIYDLPVVRLLTEELEKMLHDQKNLSHTVCNLSNFMALQVCGDVLALIDAAFLRPADIDVLQHLRNSISHYNAFQFVSISEKLVSECSNLTLGLRALSGQLGRSKIMRDKDDRSTWELFKLWHKDALSVPEDADFIISFYEFSQKLSELNYEAGINTEASDSAPSSADDSSTEPEPSVILDKWKSHDTFDEYIASLSLHKYFRGKSGKRRMEHVTRTLKPFYLEHKKGGHDLERWKSLAIRVFKFNYLKCRTGKCSQADGCFSTNVIAAHHRDFTELRSLMLRSIFGAQELPSVENICEAFRNNYNVFWASQLLLGFNCEHLLRSNCLDHIQTNKVRKIRNHWLHGNAITESVYHVREPTKIKPEVDRDYRYVFQVLAKNLQYVINDCCKITDGN